MCCSPGYSLLGIGLGIASVVQKTEKKTLGIIGLVINGLIFITLFAQILSVLITVCIAIIYGEYFSL